LHGSGAPKGKRNGNYRHGFYTAEAIAERRAVRALIRKLAVGEREIARGMIEELERRTPQSRNSRARCELLK
jgi:predicted oxidoreductase (fatty acid repression mutant protein)